MQRYSPWRNEELDNKANLLYLKIDIHRCFDARFGPWCPSSATQAIRHESIKVAPIRIMNNILANCRSVNDKVLLLSHRILILSYIANYSIARNNGTTLPR
jgi:hypothetical protein